MNTHTVYGRPTLKDVERFLALVSPQALQEINLQIKAWNSEIPIWTVENLTNTSTKYLEFTKKKAQVHAYMRVVINSQQQIPY